MLIYSGTQTKTSTSGTPLHYAVRNGHEDLVRFLLTAGADHQRWCTNLCDCNADRAHSRGSRGSRSSRYQMFHWSPFHLALCSGHTPIADVLIDWGASCERIFEVTPLRNFGPGPLTRHASSTNILHELAIYGNVVVIDHLIATRYHLGAIINAVDSHGDTPLHFLAKSRTSRDVDTLDRFLSLKPDLSILDSRQHGLINCFIFSGSMRAALRLFRLGIRPNQSRDCIFSAIRTSLPRVEPYPGYDQMWTPERHELIMLLIKFALDTGELTRDASQDQPERGSQLWSSIFRVACYRPPLLQDLLQAGFRPHYLIERSLLFISLQTLIRSRDAKVWRPLQEATRMLTEAGERWDTIDQRHQKTPLDLLVQDGDSMDQEVLETSLDSLLGSRSPEGSGAEQAHLDQSAQYALGHGKMHVYRRLITLGANPAPGYKDTKHRDLWLRYGFNQT